MGTANSQRLASLAPSTKDNLSFRSSSMKSGNSLLERVFSARRLSRTSFRPCKVMGRGARKRQESSRRTYSAVRSLAWRIQDDRRSPFPHSNEKMILGPSRSIYFSTILRSLEDKKKTGASASAPGRILCGTFFKSKTGSGSHSHGLTQFGSL